MECEERMFPLQVLGLTMSSPLPPPRCFQEERKGALLPQQPVFVSLCSLALRVR